MIGDNYISINGETIPNPAALKISYTNEESIGKAEAGTDIGTVRRLLKRTFAFSFDSSSRGRAKIKTFCALAECQAVIQGETMTGRLRLTGESMLKNSEYVANTDGLWTLTVNFIEK